MQTASDSWAAEWARLAEQVPGGRLAAGLLVDLVADPRQHLARTATFPVNGAAAALRVEPRRLREALRELADVGLTTVADHDSGEAGEVVVVTLTVPAAEAKGRARAAGAGEAASAGGGRPRPSDGGSGPLRVGGESVDWASPEDEEAMGLVAARLRSTHPGADPATVDALVVRAYDELRDAKVRTFIPILAERRVRSLLAASPPDTRPARSG
ncbi:three-helix bundle dimerization domain-containing protein [Kitasatospora sp. NPDC048365]|uniref:three-helix bundle dimerization domain-containing protein n=1 Tax=Kitasatospora sp. NPDC048365 TaxID=3364050 RepID=UPI00371895E0